MVMATLLLTIFVSLTVGIIAGLGIAVLTYFLRFVPSKNKDNHQEIVGDTQVLNVNKSLYFGNARKLSLGMANAKTNKLEVKFAENALFDSSGVEALKDIKNSNPGKQVSLVGVTRKLQVALDELGISDLYKS